jgi:nucleolar pre-ribosomal-associated protein 2
VLANLRNDLRLTLLGYREKSKIPPVDDFDLPRAYNALVREFIVVKTTKRFRSIAGTLHRILKSETEKPVKQWNVDSTLSAISSLCPTDELNLNDGSAKERFTWLCKLVKAILERYRNSLKGRNHLLVTVMQSLLRFLFLGQANSWRSSWEDEARAYERLVSMICKPTSMSVGRGQRAMELESEADATKKNAGRCMYLVLTYYVKLLLEEDTTHEVREALEPGMNAIFEVTSPDMRKIMNDGLDASGRVILRELFGRYTKFGKWAGF